MVKPAIGLTAAVEETSEQLVQTWKNTFLHGTNMEVERDLQATERLNLSKLS
jgi:hypothetical protein